MGTWNVWRDIGREDQTEFDAAYDGSSIDQHVIQTWIAEYSDVTATTLDAASASGIPVAGSYYTLAGIPWWKVIRVMPKRSTESPFTFEVQVEYERKISLNPGDPWDITIAFSGSPFSQTAYKDKDGNDIVNSAGQSFDPTLQKQYFDEKLDISYKTTSPPDLSDYYGKVNSDEVSFTISGISRDYTARQLKFTEGNISTTLTLGDTGNTPVWDVKLSFLARQDTYVNSVLDQGLCEIKAGKLAPILDEVTKQNINSPARLNGSGVHLAVGGTPVFLTFKIEDETALSPLFDGLS